MDERTYQVKKCIICQQDFQPTGPRHATCGACVAAKKVGGSAGGRKANRTCNKCGAGRKDAKIHVGCDGSFGEPVVAFQEHEAPPLVEFAPHIFPTFLPTATPGSHERWVLNPTVHNSPIGKRFYNALLGIRKLTYRSEERGEDFDTAVLRIFQRNDFRKLEKGTPESYENMGKENVEGFVTQPYGSQSAPDFLVFLGEFGVVPVETKRSKTGEVMWNGGYPRPNTIYIYSGADGATSESDVTFLWGSSLISWQDIIKIEEATRQLKELGKMVNTDLLSDVPMDISFVRPMFKERVSANRKWLSSIDRKQRENAVLSCFASEGT